MNLTEYLKLALKNLVQDWSDFYKKNKFINLYSKWNLKEYLRLTLKNLVQDWSDFCKKTNLLISIRNGILENI